MASNLLNLDTTTLANAATSSVNKSLYIGAYPAGVNWYAVQDEVNRLANNLAVAYPALRSLLNAPPAGVLTNRKVGDTNNNGTIDNTDWLNIGYYQNGAAQITAGAREWIAEYIEKVIHNNPTAYLLEGSYYNTANSTPIVSIFGGSNSTILGNPTGNLDKIFFDSRFDYLRVRSVVNFTVSLPDRNTRASSGGKKGGSQLTSYNGYADRYIYYHNYGTPPPAFSVYLDDDIANGSYKGMALAGSVPIQYASNNSFRIALVYSTDKYLVLRERYQVYQNSLPAMSLKITGYFYNNPTSINAISGLGIVHSPVTFNDVSPYGSPVRGRSLSKTATFTSTGGTSFNRVEILRFGGGDGSNFGNPYTITAINGASVTPYDTYNTWTVYNYPSLQTSWSFTCQTTDIPKTEAIGKNKYVYYTPRYAIRFTNTGTGQTFTDSFGGVFSFYIQP